jgi:hypothetical protein
VRRGVIGQIRRGRLAFVAEVLSQAHVLDQRCRRSIISALEQAERNLKFGKE